MLVRARVIRDVGHSCEVMGPSELPATPRYTKSVFHLHQRLVAALEDSAWPVGRHACDSRIDIVRIKTASGALEVGVTEIPLEQKIRVILVKQLDLVILESQAVREPMRLSNRCAERTYCVARLEKSAHVEGADAEAGSRLGFYNLARLRPRSRVGIVTR